MAGVVEDLIFQADGRAGGGFRARAGDGIKIGLAEIFDAAVRAPA
jgi:hypothetical protein